MYKTIPNLKTEQLNLKRANMRKELIEICEEYTTSDVESDALYLKLLGLFNVGKRVNWHKISDNKKEIPFSQVLVTDGGNMYFGWLIELKRGVSAGIETEWTLSPEPKEKIRITHWTERPTLPSY